MVVVEAPSKAKTLQRYLGSGYAVLASYGHVRDLLSKIGSVRPEENFACTWAFTERSEKILSALEDHLKTATRLTLATDPDREGEAIAWHILEALQERGSLPETVSVDRVMFHSITKEAVLEAFKHPRPINAPLVEAYRARLSLDYLFGYTLSPVLWRKLPKSKSAGRVQSVALRAVVEKEQDIEAFCAQNYWSVAGTFSKDKTPFSAKVTHVNGQKLEKLSISSEDEAGKIQETLEGASAYTVLEVTSKEVQRKPKPPFMTSTLQQAASVRLGFSPTRTMKVAQELYEGIVMEDETVGLITYMRTDSLHIEPDALKTCRATVLELWGDAYLPEKSFAYKSRVKNAQEAHEAVRPTRFNVPESLKPFLTPDQFKIYDLIWKRAMASQMNPSRMLQTQATVGAKEHDVRLQASGSALLFDGFLRAWDAEPEEEEEGGRFLPALFKDDSLTPVEFSTTAHTTQAPARYSEAGLIQRMEEVGIGRPSTYARILHVLQERGYVVHDKKRLYPSVRGRIVTAFLKRFFGTYLEYDFTAKIEDALDDVSSGKALWTDVLQSWWAPFYEKIAESTTLKMGDVLQAVQNDLHTSLFPGAETTPPCPLCAQGTLSLKLGRFGPFVGCSAYPDCKHIVKLSDGPEKEEGATARFEPRVLGLDGEVDVVVRKGPYGFYIQWGVGAKPVRATLPKMLDPNTVTMDMARFLKQFPKLLGPHPETGDPLVLGIGSTAGPYVLYQKRYFSLRLPVEQWPAALTFSLNDGLQRLNKPSKSKKKPKDDA